MPKVVNAKNIIASRNSILSSLTKNDGLNKTTMFHRMLWTALDAQREEFAVNCQSKSSVARMKYGRFVLDYSGFPSNIITLSIFSIPETFTPVGSFEFPDDTIEDVSSSLSGVNIKYAQNDDGFFMLYTGAVGLMFIRCLSALSEYNLPRGCWVPQFEDEAIEWLDNFGASKPEFVPLENSLEKKQVQPMKQISSAVNDDISL